MFWYIPWYWSPVVLIIGIVIGWFLNIIIQRYPRHESLLYLPYCPSCKQTISARNNIPIASYFLLKQKCATCDNPISLRYPAVEILTGLLLMFLYRTHGFRLDFYFASLFFIDLILIGFIDLEKEKIPFPLTFGGIILGIVFNMMRRNYFSPLFGFLFGWGIVYLIYFIGHKTEKKDVVGNEEMFLAGMIGAFLGLRTAIIAVFIGTLIALIYGVKMKRKMIPFAPFLACGAIIAYFFAADIIRLICPFFFIIP